MRLSSMLSRATLLSGLLLGISSLPCVASATSSDPQAELPPRPPAHTEFFPLSAVHRGLKGVAYTVFEGTDPEPMGVEILGVLNDAIGPGQDMILGRLTGAKAEYTGVVAGMSGSPVYVDGKLVGALSYRIGSFSKEPICGITPIAQMLEVRDSQKSGEGMQVAATDRSSPAVTPTSLSTATAPGAPGREIQPIDTALVFGGFSQKAIDLFGDRFRAMGMSPVAGLGGAAAAGTRQPEPIVPGSAVSAVLVRGDLSISGTCTVTYVDPHQLLACGHPITQYGPVAMPMTKAEVLATLASPLNSFKIINTTETVGEFTEDRASAILGRFGETARMIPVSVDVLPPPGSARLPKAESVAMLRPISTSESRSAQLRTEPAPGPIAPIPPAGGPAAVAPHGMRFEVLDNPALTPQAMLVSVYQSLSGTNAAENQMSYRMSGDLTLKGQPPVHLEGIMAPTELGSGAVSAALYVNDRFGRLYSNSLEQPTVTGLHLTMQQLPGRRSAVLEGARLASSDVHPGDEVEVEATIHPYQAAAEVVRLHIKLPDTLARGSVRMLVSDSSMLDRLTDSGGGSTTPGIIVLGGSTARPVPLADAVSQMNRAHPNDRVYVTLLEHAPQAGLDTEALPEIPLSFANALEPLKTSQGVQLNGESALEVGSRDVGYALSGSQVLNITVR